MEMVNKIKSLTSGSAGSRIASVHNGSSLFTGDAGSGESNIRRYIIENDLLEAIVQMPNNLFYNTGITTYVWLLSNNKSVTRQGKVQLIDGSLLFKKLRKNLGEKNCEFTSEHIEEIVRTYLNLSTIERALDDNGDSIGIASQVFDNNDFAYYKVNIERPDRRKAQFSPARNESLRFDKQLQEPMAHLYQTHGNKVYEAGFLKEQQKAMLEWCEENEFSLNAKARTKLLDLKVWQKHLNLVTIANVLMTAIGENEYSDFNQFKRDIDASLKASKTKLDASGKNAILNAVSWYDETAEKVIKKKQKLSRDKLTELLAHLDCQQTDLADHGYYQVADSNEYIIYESNSDLRDAESIPLKDNIHRYFLAEVKPHVDEAWINLDSTKLGYEISFNKYFYRHKPLRSTDEVAQDIIGLEQKAEGLIADILGIAVADIDVGV